MNCSVKFFVPIVIAGRRPAPGAFAVGAAAAAAGQREGDASDEGGVARHAAAARDISGHGRLVVARPGG